MFVHTSGQHSLKRVSGAGLNVSRVFSRVVKGGLIYNNPIQRMTKEQITRTYMPNRKLGLITYKAEASSPAQIADEIAVAGNGLRKKTMSRLSARLRSMMI